MEDLKPALEWLGGNWGWVISLTCIFFEIAPVKLHPVSFVLNWLGKKLTGDVRADLADLKARIEDTEKAVDFQRMAAIRTTILDFANSCRNGRKHSKEEFTHVLAENDDYEKLIEKYGIKNNVYHEDYTFIKLIYHECQRENKFLA